MKSYINIFLSLGFLLIACQSNTNNGPKFEHNITKGPTPWTSDIFELTEQDFTFAIIADLNGGEREGVYITAVSQLNRLDPTFVLSIGDLIDGGTQDSLQLAKEWDSFAQRTAKLNMPFFYLGGNHDLTNPKMREFWKNRFGTRYYHFLYEDVLFLMLDSEDYEETRMLEIYYARAEAIKIIEGEIPGKFEESEYYNMLERNVGAMGKQQVNYFKTVLEKHPKVKWIFVLMHKPLWMREDDKGLGELEKLLNKRPYTVINGHLHSLSHRKRYERDYLMLGTTGGAQNKTDSMAFDHVTLVRMAETPIITHLKMNGILDETGKLPKIIDD